MISCGDHLPDLSECESDSECVSREIQVVCRAWHVHTADIFAQKLLHTSCTLDVVIASNIYGPGLSSFFWNAFVKTYDVVYI